VPRAGEVALTVHDLRGREVARLFEGHRQAGRHEAVWETELSLPTGVYFGRLSLGGREVAACKVSIVK
jgi:hypothetical protein